MQQASWIDVLHSRKFWALIIALLAIVAGFATKQLDAWQAIQAAVAALAAYSTGVAIEDAGFKAGAPQRAATTAAAYPPPSAPLPALRGGAGGEVGSPPSHMIPPYNPGTELTYLPPEEDDGPTQSIPKVASANEYRTRDV